MNRQPTHKSGNIRSARHLLSKKHFRRQKRLQSNHKNRTTTRNIGSQLSSNVSIGELELNPVSGREEETTPSPLTSHHFTHSYSSGRSLFQHHNSTSFQPKIITDAVVHDSDIHISPAPFLPIITHSRPSRSLTNNILYQQHQHPSTPTRLYNQSTRHFSATQQESEDEIPSSLSKKNPHSSPLSVKNTPTALIDWKMVFPLQCCPEWASSFLVQLMKTDRGQNTLQRFISSIPTNTLNYFESLPDHTLRWEMLNAYVVVFPPVHLTHTVSQRVEKEQWEENFSKFPPNFFVPADFPIYSHIFNAYAQGISKSISRNEVMTYISLPSSSSPLSSSSPIASGPLSTSQPLLHPKSTPINDIKTQSHHKNGSNEQHLNVPTNLQTAIERLFTVTTQPNAGPVQYTRTPSLSMSILQHQYGNLPPSDQKLLDNFIYHRIQFRRPEQIIDLLRYITERRPEDTVVLSDFMDSIWPGKQLGQGLNVILTGKQLSELISYLCQNNRIGVVPLVRNWVKNIYTPTSNNGSSNHSNTTRSNVGLTPSLRPGRDLDSKVGTFQSRNRPQREVNTTFGSNIGPSVKSTLQQQQEELRELLRKKALGENDKSATLQSSVQSVAPNVSHRDRYELRIRTARQRYLEQFSTQFNKPFDVSIGHQYPLASIITIKNITHLDPQFLGIDLNSNSNDQSDHFSNIPLNRTHFGTLFERYLHSYISLSTLLARANKFRVPHLGYYFQGRVVPIIDGVSLTTTTTYRQFSSMIFSSDYTNSIVFPRHLFSPAFYLHSTPHTLTSAQLAKASHPIDPNASPKRSQQTDLERVLTSTSLSSSMGPHTWHALYDMMVTSKEQMAWEAIPNGHIASLSQIRLADQFPEIPQANITAQLPTLKQLRTKIDAQKHPSTALSSILNHKASNNINIGTNLTNKLQPSPQQQQHQSKSPTTNTNDSAFSLFTSFLPPFRSKSKPDMGDLYTVSFTSLNDIQAEHNQYHEKKDFDNGDENNQLLAGDVFISRGEDNAGPLKRKHQSTHINHIVPFNCDDGDRSYDQNENDGHHADPLISHHQENSSMLHHSTLKLGNNQGGNFTQDGSNSEDLSLSPISTKFTMAISQTNNSQIATAFSSSTSSPPQSPQPTTTVSAAVKKPPMIKRKLFCRTVFRLPMGRKSRPFPIHLETNNTFAMMTFANSQTRKFELENTMASLGYREFLGFNWSHSHYSNSSFFSNSVEDKFLDTISGANVENLRTKVDPKQSLLQALHFIYTMTIPTLITQYSPMRDQLPHEFAISIEMDVAGTDSAKLIFIRQDVDKSDYSTEKTTEMNYSDPNLPSFTSPYRGFIIFEELKNTHRQYPFISNVSSHAIWGNIAIASQYLSYLQDTDSFINLDEFTQRKHVLQQPSQVFGKFLKNWSIDSTSPPRFYCWRDERAFDYEVSPDLSTDFQRIYELNNHPEAFNALTKSIPIKPFLSPNQDGSEDPKSSIPRPMMYKRIPLPTEIEIPTPFDKQPYFSKVSQLQVLKTECSHVGGKDHVEHIINNSSHPITTFTNKGISPLPQQSITPRNRINKTMSVSTSSEQTWNPAALSSQERDKLLYEHEDSADNTLLSTTNNITSDDDDDIGYIRNQTSSNDVLKLMTDHSNTSNNTDVTIQRGSDSLVNCNSNHKVSSPLDYMTGSLIEMVHGQHHSQGSENGEGQAKKDNPERTRFVLPMNKVPCDYARDLTFYPGFGIEAYDGESIPQFPFGRVVNNTPQITHVMMKEIIPQGQYYFDPELDYEYIKQFYTPQDDPASYSSIVNREFDVISSTVSPLLSHEEIKSMKESILHPGASFFPQQWEHLYMLSSINPRPNPILPPRNTPITLPLKTSYAIQNLPSDVQKYYNQLISVAAEARVYEKQSSLHSPSSFSQYKRNYGNGTDDYGLGKFEMAIAGIDSNEDEDISNMGFEGSNRIKYPSREDIIQFDKLRSDYKTPHTSPQPQPSPQPSQRPQLHNPNNHSHLTPPFSSNPNIPSQQPRPRSPLFGDPSPRSPMTHMPTNHHNQQQTAATPPLPPSQPQYIVASSSRRQNTPPIFRPSSQSIPSTPNDQIKTPDATAFKNPEYKDPSSRLWNWRP